MLDYLLVCDCYIKNIAQDLVNRLTIYSVIGNFPKMLGCNMSTMNISLLESLKEFVEVKVKNRTYSTNNEYVKNLIRKELGREKLRNALLEDAKSTRSA